MKYLLIVILTASISVVFSVTIVTRIMVTKKHDANLISQGKTFTEKSAVESSSNSNLNQLSAEIFTQINTLKSSHQLLALELERISGRLVNIEQITALNGQNNRGDSSSDDTLLDPVEAHYQELFASENAAQIEERLSQYENQFANEPVDESWAADMQLSFGEIENRLKELSIDSIRLTERDCRSSLCRVTFEHIGTDAQTNIMPALIGTSTTGKVHLEHIKENNRVKTIAYYERSN